MPTRIARPAADLAMQVGWHLLAIQQF